MPSRRLPASVLALAASFVAPLVALAPASADAPASAVVYLSDADNVDGLYGIYAAPSNDLSHPHPVLATHSSLDVLAAKLSPSGAEVAALVDPKAGSSTDQGDYELEVLTLDGSGRRTLVTPVDNDTTVTQISGFSWAGNDSIVIAQQTVTFNPATFTSATSSDLGLVHLAGSGATPLPNTDGMSDPAVAPDGTTVAATYLDPDAPRGEVGLRIYDLLSGHVGATSLDVGYLGEPAWSADGMKVAYVKDTSTNSTFRSALEVITRETTTAQDPSLDTYSAPADLVATDGSYFDENPSWAADGTVWMDRVDTSSSRPKQTLWTAAADGSNLQQVLSGVGDAGNPTVGPADGTPPPPPTFAPFDLAGSQTTLHWAPSVDNVGFLYTLITRTNPDGSTKTFAASGNSFVDSTVVGATYTYTAVEVDGAGNQSAPSAPRQVTALSVPHIVVATPTSTSSTSTSFPVSWAGANNPAGTHYAVREVTLPTWSGPLVSTTQPRTTIKGSPGTTYAFQAQVGDAFGNTSFFTPWTYAAVPYDQTAGAYSRGWSTVRSTALWLGSEASTATNSATVSFTVTSKSVQVIGDKLPNGAYFKVYVAGVYRGTVSTAASTTRHRQVLWSRSLGSTAKRTVKLVAVVGRGKVLRIDALAASR